MTVYDVVYPIEKGGVVYVPAAFLRSRHWRRLAGADPRTRITLNEVHPRVRELVATGFIAVAP